MSPIERARIRRNVGSIVEACGIGPRTDEGQQIVNRYDALMRATIRTMLADRLRRIRNARRAWREAGAKRAGHPC